jgi:high-affinity nickel-transport protein
MAVGIAIIVLKVSIPARLGLLMEFAVALMLIVLGLSSTREVIRALVRRFVRRPPSPEPALIHSHRHSHGDFEHSHPHLHRHAHETDATTAHDHLAQMQASAPPRRPLLQSFGVGLVHGMAGSAAIALLALSAIPYPAWAVLYLTVFCLGTIIGMLLITTALATPFVFAAARVSQLHRGLQAGAGLLSFAFGAFIAWQVGINDHLFGALPNWTPH